jgi:putative signal transducing protein
MENVTVYTAFNPMDAQVVRAQLESAGLHPEVMGELAALSIEGYSLAAGGIRVDVPGEEAADARELIDSWKTPPQ